MNVLITGANRGLGFDLTKLGLEKGYRIFAGVRHVGENMDSLRKVLEKYPSQLTIVQLDVVDEVSVVHAQEKISSISPKLDCVINNAGVLLENESVLENLDVSKFMTTFDVNTLGPLRVIKHFLPLLRKGVKPSIVNVSSEAGSLTNAYSGDYSYGISKAALNMLSEKVNMYLKDTDIHVYSIHPGWMKTDMGGQKAPLDPMETSKGIYDIIERKTIVDSEHIYIDYKGIPMAI